MKETTMEKVLAEFEAICGLTMCRVPTLGLLNKRTCSLSNSYLRCKIPWISNEVHRVSPEMFVQQLFNEWMRSELKRPSRIDKRLKIYLIIWRKQIQWLGLATHLGPRSASHTSAELASWLYLNYRVNFQRKSRVLRASLILIYVCIDIFFSNFRAGG